MADTSGPVQALLDRLDGGPTPGHLGLVAAASSVDKTVLVTHVGLHALLSGKRLLHVSAVDPVAKVLGWYDELLRAGELDVSAGERVELERRRMALSYVDRTLSVEALAEQVAMFSQVAQFAPDVIVLDGLDADDFAAMRADLAAMSADLPAPVWVAVTASDPISTGDDVAFGLRLDEGGESVRLHLRDGEGFRELPWALDHGTHLLGRASGSTRAVPPKASDSTLYSGGAAGSEAAFGEAAERWGVREVHFTFEGHKQARTVGSATLGPRELEAGDVSLVYVSRRLNRTFNEHGLVRKVLQTLWHMVSRSQQIFVIGAIQEDGTVVGGTGWSVELARMWSKDLWVFDQHRHGWFHWDGASWVEGTAAITSPQFCGTGTRYLDDSGRKAIDDLFARAFG